MIPLLQQFEFSYDGTMFYDRSGSLVRRLRDLIPGLVLKATTNDQRDLSAAQQDLDLYFGISVAKIQTLAFDQESFPSVASSFLRTVAELLEFSRIDNFRYRHVLGKACATHEEANALIWPLVPEETKSKLAQVAETAAWDALQGEFTVGRMACMFRIAVVDLIPHRDVKLSFGKPGHSVPFVTFQTELRGLSPIALADFDAEAFMKNAREERAREILAKIGPKL